MMLWVALVELFVLVLQIPVCQSLYVPLPFSAPPRLAVSVRPCLSRLRMTSEHRVFLSFPHIPVKLGVKILNTPEAWADRVAHRLSLPPVVVSDVINMPKVGKDNTLSCQTQYGPVTLTSLSPTHLVINMHAHVQIDIVLSEYSEKCDAMGFCLLVTVRAGPNLYVQGQTSIDLIPGLPSQDHLRNAVESVFLAYENYMHNVTEIPSMACIELWRSLNLH